LVGCPLPQEAGPEVAKPTPVRRALVVLWVAAIASLARTQPASGDWAASQAAVAIQTLLERRVVDTDPDGLFRPHATLSRARFLRWLVTAKGLPTRRVEHSTFGDIPASHPEAPFVEAASRYGLVSDQVRFRPAEAVRREDAVDWVVRALGYRWEADWLASRVDTPGPVTPALVLATRTEPPLLQDSSGVLRRDEPLTRGEAAGLLWAYLRAVEEGVRLRYQQVVSSGLLLAVEKRGALRALPTWRVQVGAFGNPDNAQRLASRMRDAGLVASVDELDGLYKVRVGSFATRREAEQLATRLREEGLPTWVLSTVRDLERLPGPQWVAALRVDPDRFEVRPVLARDQVPGRERTSEISRRVGALAAINGGFFAPDGDPAGGLVVDGEWVSEPVPGRTCLGLGEGFVLMDALDWQGKLVAPGVTVRLSGVNRVRRSGEVILYTPRFGQATRGDAELEVVVAGGVVREARSGGSAAIPPDGYVVSASGTATAALQGLRAGDPVRVLLSLHPASGDARWQAARHVVCGGPRLVLGGVARPAHEGFPDGFRNRRHPRTAVGIGQDGSLLLVVVDGRWPEHGLGMTLEELARELVALGAREAVNLDGGGSTTLVVGGTVANRPSDEGGERPVSDAVVVRPRGVFNPPSRPSGKWVGTGR